MPGSHLSVGPSGQLYSLVEPRKGTLDKCRAKSVNSKVENNVFCVNLLTYHYSLPDRHDNNPLEDRNSALLLPECQYPPSARVVHQIGTLRQNNFICPTLPPYRPLNSRPITIKPVP